MTEAERRKRKNNKELDKKMLIFHRQFHPRDIERRTIQKAFKKHMRKEEVEGNTENNEKRERLQQAEKLTRPPLSIKPVST